MMYKQKKIKIFPMMRKKNINFNFKKRAHRYACIKNYRYVRFFYHSSRDFLRNKKKRKIK